MDFETLNGVWKLKRFCMICVELIFKFSLCEFCFQFEFLFNFDFQMHKTNLKSFVFEMLFIGDYIVRPFISLVAKFEVYNVLRQFLFEIRAGNSNLAKSLSEKSNHAMYQDENPHRCLLSS